MLRACCLQKNDLILQKGHPNKRDALSLFPIVHLGFFYFWKHLGDMCYGFGSMTDGAVTAIFHSVLQDDKLPAALIPQQI